MIDDMSWTGGLRAVVSRRLESSRVTRLYRGNRITNVRQRSFVALMPRTSRLYLKATAKHAGKCFKTTAIAMLRSETLFVRYPFSDQRALLRPELQFVAHGLHPRHAARHGKRFLNLYLRIHVS